MQESEEHRHQCRQGSNYRTPGGVPRQATRYLREGASIDFEEVPFTEGEELELAKIPNLVISNWNVERPLPGQARFARIADTLSGIKSDVWFLTETHEALVPKSGFHSVFSGTPDRDSSDGERWGSIWSRWPITPLNDYVSDKSRCVAGIIENSPFGQLVLYGTVLPWNTDPRAKQVGSYLAFQENLDLQQGDWERIRTDFPAHTNSFILAGDFNQSLAPIHYYGSNERRTLLETALRRFHFEPITHLENDPIFRDSPPNACIDHICHSLGMWEIINTKRWSDAPNLKGADSDHFGVSVEIG